MNENKRIFISCSRKYWLQYALGGGRLWFVVDKITALKEKNSSPCVLKGYFDGSFLNFKDFQPMIQCIFFSGTLNRQVEKGLIWRLNKFRTKSTKRTED